MLLVAYIVLTSFEVFIIIIITSQLRSYVRHGLTLISVSKCLYPSTPLLRRISLSSSLCCSNHYTCLPGYSKYYYAASDTPDPCQCSQHLAATRSLQAGCTLSRQCAVRTLAPIKEGFAMWSPCVRGFSSQTVPLRR